MSPEMQYVYTVYQEKSFSKAAEKLFITQPALSIAVQKIEQSIGMSLFDRKSKPLKLTDAGEIYIESIKKIMEVEEERDNQLSDIQHLITGKIRIGGTHYLNAYILPEILTGFSKTYPGVKLEIYEKSAFDLSQMLEENELQVIFNCDPNFIKDYPSYKLFEDHVLLAVPKDEEFNQRYEHYAMSAEDVHKKRFLSPTSPHLPLSALSELDLIMLRKGNNLYERAVKMFEDADIQPKIKMELNQLVTAYHLSESGMASTFVSDLIVKRESDNLLFYPLDSPLATREFYILLQRKAYIPVAVERFVTYALENMRY